MKTKAKYHPHTYGNVCISMLLYYINNIRNMANINRESY